MKDVHKSAPDERMHRVAAEVETRMKALFGRCPELAGFAVQDLTGSAEEKHALEHEPALFVTDIGFSAVMGEDEIEETYHLIGSAISDVVAEQPEAIELLCGRTFARTLH